MDSRLRGNDRGNGVRLAGERPEAVPVEESASGGGLVLRI
jgi:hypothetical protein